MIYTIALIILLALRLIRNQVVDEFGLLLILLIIHSLGVI